MSLSVIQITVPQRCSWAAQTFDGFDPTYAQVLSAVPEDTLFSESVEDRAYDRPAHADKVRKLLLGEADVLAEAVLAPRLKSPG